MENKKVRNAKITIVDGIKFKSKSEAFMYNLLLESGLTFDYKPNPIILQEGFYPSGWYEKQEFKKSKIIRIVYTPDFIVTFNNITFIIEVKGFKTDRYSLKRKMLLNKIKDDPSVIFIEVHTQQDMIFCINKIKSYGNTSG